MNILLLLFSYNTGGIERLLIDMANGLILRGHHVSLCIINDAYDIELLHQFNPKVQIHYLNRPNHSCKRFTFMMQFARIVKENHIQIIHCQDLNCVIFAILSKLLCPSIAIIDTVHDTMAYKTYSKLQITIEKILCRKIIAISQAVKHEIESRNIPVRKIALIYNAIDTSKFPLQSGRQLTKEQVILGNVARIQPSIKGQLVLLQAMTILTEKYPHILCKFAGGVAYENKDDYEMLLQYITTHHLESNVSFLGDVKDIPAFLKSIDIFILPSLFEGFGISLIEAMSTGLPCIASDIDGPAEIISNHSLGLLFQVRNSSELAEKIEYVIEHYDEFDHHIISNNISCRFSIDTMLTQLVTLYQQLLN